MLTVRFVTMTVSINWTSTILWDETEISALPKTAPLKGLTAVIIVRPGEIPLTLPNLSTDTIDLFSLVRRSRT